jgi:hypothetical protein
MVCAFAALSADRFGGGKPTKNEGNHLFSILLFSELSLFLHLLNRKRNISYEIWLDDFQK